MKKQSVPKRGNRYILFDDGDGDVRIYSISGPEGPSPTGSLIPITGVPGFQTKPQAIKYVKNNHKRFEGMQLMIIRGLEIMAPRITTSIEMDFKPKKVANVDGEKPA